MPCVGERGILRAIEREGRATFTFGKSIRQIEVAANSRREGNF